MLSWGWIFLIAHRGGIPILEKHMTRGLIGILLDVGDELHDRTSHEVTLIDLASVTDGGHVFLEGKGHP